MKSVCSAYHLAITTVYFLVIDQHLQKVIWKMPTSILSLYNLLFKCRLFAGEVFVVVSPPKTFSRYKNIHLPSVALVS